MRFQDKSVIVTGAAGGIGSAIAARFAGEGAQVVVTDVNADGAEATAAAIRATGGRARAFAADIVTAEGCQSIVADAIANEGRIDVLCNNAGINRRGPLLSLTSEDWRLSFAVNVDAMFHTCQAALPHMIAAGGGAIVNMASVAGKFGFPLRSPYSTSKWAVIGFTKSLAIELGPSKIRVNAILPGIVSGERIRQVFTARAAAKGISYDEMARQALERVSLRTMVDPEEIADLVLFLCSRYGRAITGDAIEICGGTESIV